MSGRGRIGCMLDCFLQYVTGMDVQFCEDVPNVELDGHSLFGPN